MADKKDDTHEVGATDVVAQLAALLVETRQGADAQFRALGDQVVAELRQWREASSRPLSATQARTELEFRALTTALGHGGTSPILAGSTVTDGHLTLRGPLPPDAARVEAFDAKGTRRWWVDDVGGLARIDSRHITAAGVVRVVVLDAGGRPLLLTHPVATAPPPVPHAGT